MKAMKNLMLVSLLIGLGACSNHEQDVLETSKYITVDAGFGTDSRVATDGLASVFQESDAIGVYAWTGETTLPNSEDGFQVYNVTNTFDGTNWSATPQMLWQDGTTPHYFLAVYPATDILTTTAYTLDPTNQERSDLLVATNFGEYEKGIVAQANPVPLAFGHIMAKLRVNIKFNDEFAGTKPIVQEVVAEAKTTADVDWQTAEVKNPGTPVGVKLPNLADATHGYVYSYESVMIPQDGFKSVAVAMGTDIYTFNSTTDIPLNKGVITTLNLIVGRSSVEVDGITILDWTLDGVVDGYLNNISQQIEDLTDKLNTLTNSTADKDVNLQESIAEQQKALDELEAAVEELAKTSGTIATIQATIENLQSQITSISTAISGIEALIKNRIQSIRFLPEYSDGKVEITSKAIAVDLTFIVSPKEAATKVEKNHVSAYIYHTQSRSVETETPQSLEVTTVSGDNNGILTVTVDPSKLPTDYWEANKEANIYIQINDGNTDIQINDGNTDIQINDGNTDIISEMIPVFYSVICELPEGTTFRSAVANVIGNATAIRFVANSNLGSAFPAGSNMPGYVKYQIVESTLELHTPASEFVFNQDCYAMFSSFNDNTLTVFQNLTSIDFNDCINTTEVTSMASMFATCSQLTSLDLSGFNTSKVEYMTSMFTNCNSLTSLDIRNFDVSKLTYCSNMFSNVGYYLVGGAKTNIIVTKELKEKLSTKITIPSTAQYVQLDGVTLWE